MSAYQTEDGLRDIARFAADLAEALGGTSRPYWKPDEGRTAAPYDPQSVTFPEGHRFAACWLHLRRDYTLSGTDKIHISASSAALGSGAARLGIRVSDLRFPSGNFSLSRPLPSLIRDIEKRVLVPALAPVSAVEDRIRKAQEADEGVKQAVEDYRRAPFGNKLDIRMTEGEPSARVFSRGPAHIDGSIRSDGSLDLSRVWSIPQEKALKVLAVLLE